VGFAVVVFVLVVVVVGMVLLVVEADGDDVVGVEQMTFQALYLATGWQAGERVVYPLLGYGLPVQVEEV
jgi:hypothetical protein